MKKFVLNFGFVLTQLLLVVSCEQLDVDDEVINDQATLKSDVADGWTVVDDGLWSYSAEDVMYDICGEGDTYPFYESAMVTISNDENCIYVKVVAEDGWKIQSLAFNAWPIGSPDINDNYGSFPYRNWFDSEELTDMVTFKVCDQWEGTECLVFNIKLRTVNDEGGSKYWWVTTDNQIKSDRSNIYIDYCRMACECLPYRTQTPGGWGAPARGNNPGVYRDDNFEAAFPDGLFVGMDDGGYSLLLTDADAVENFLPSGGKPAALKMNYMDPTSKQLKNSFASHVVALTLSVEFDAHDEEFSQATANLGELTFKAESGFYGLTVQNVLDEANRVLGGADSDYTLDELHTFVTMVNEYYVDGKWTGDGMLLDDCWNYTDN